MAIVRHSSFSWTSSGPGHEMAPGEIHYYSFENLTDQEAVSIGVHPQVTGFPRCVLVVENVQGVTGFGEFRNTEFRVRNAGYNSVWSYSVGIGIISA